MGGAHASCDPEGVLKSPWVDYVVMGEGEIRFPLLLETVEKGGVEEIDGIGFRKSGRIRMNPLETFVQDLDRLPHPSRDLLDLDRYRMRKKRSTMIITSRGCPHQCAYCSTHLVMGDSFRKRSPEAILREMVECRNRYGTEVFDVEDDNLTYDQPRAKKLMQMIVQNFGEERIELTAMNGLSFASLDEELLRWMKRAGFKTVNLSFVTTDFSVKERMKRPGLTVDFKEVIRQAEEVGLHVVAYAIWGMPGQTVEEMVETLVCLMGMRVLIGPSIYYPTPGTLLFERCKREGTLPSCPSQWRSSAFPIETEEFDRLDLLTLFRLARVINLIKGKMDGGEIGDGVTWKGLSRILEEKVKAEVKVKEDNITWFQLLLLLESERSFFSLTKDSGGKMSVVKEKSSKRVLDYFFKKAWDQPILRSRNH
jgi:uncharacterized radical SAM superfamily protein